MNNFYKKQAAHSLSKLIVAQELCDEKEAAKHQLDYDNYQSMIKYKCDECKDNYANCYCLAS